MSARDEADQWLGAVLEIARKRDLRHDPIGGLNPLGEPAALCPGGTNRLTGELSDGFWGASCDADERPRGGIGRRALLPDAVLVKAHTPDLAMVVPVFNVESLDRTAGDQLVDRHARRRVEFESVEFNRRFIATVPADHDPIALRELFSPAFLDWTTRMQATVDFGITDSQLFFHWNLRERTGAELAEALDAAGGIFEQLRREMAENGVHTYPAGPWHAGLGEFPDTV